MLYKRNFDDCLELVVVNFRKAVVTSAIFEAHIAKPLEPMPYRGFDGSLSANLFIFRAVPTADLPSLNSQKRYDENLVLPYYVLKLEIGQKYRSGSKSIQQL